MDSLRDMIRANMIWLAVDPLAEDYKREFNGGDFLVQGMGEDVGDMFPADSFHLVYASNAIDHCVDPQKVITGVSVVLKRGGVFIVCGNVREGTRSGWKGYHKNDLWVDGGRLMRCGRDGVESVLIGEGWEMLREREMDYPWASEVVRWFYAEWRKR